MVKSLWTGRSSLSALLAHYQELIEQCLQECLPPSTADTTGLYEAGRYAVLAKSKRLRPCLALLTAEMLGGHIDAALLPAAALELVHTYSLVHDDLPCMDDDDLRRGQPTVHKAYSEATAVLTGDFLLTYAFQLLATAPLLDETQRIKLIATLAKHSGGDGMIGGQMLDIQGEHRHLVLKEIMNLHKKKTGALIVASLEFGGIVANASSELLSTLSDFGWNLGMLFQITDDLLNATATQELLGKPVGSDAARGKSTYLTTLGQERTQEEAKKYHDQALQCLCTLNYNTSSMQDLVRWVFSRSS